MLVANASYFRLRRIETEAQLLISGTLRKPIQV